MGSAWCEARLIYSTRREGGVRGPTHLLKAAFAAVPIARRSSMLVTRSMFVALGPPF